MLNKIWKFADDTKLSGRASLEEGSCSIETDLEEFTKWSEIWLMPLNIDKCKIMHLGKHNINKVRIIGGRNLKVVSEE